MLDPEIVYEIRLPEGAIQESVPSPANNGAVAEVGHAPLLRELASLNV